MTSTHNVEPSENSQNVLKSLQKAVSKALEKKRKLGQYAVIWDGEKPVKRSYGSPSTED